jgi:hypothetical protein
MLPAACQTGRHSNAARGLDLYETPACAVEALLRAEQLPHGLWEFAAGRGAIARVLRAHGHAVICSDVQAYDGFALHFVADFLTTTTAPAGTQAGITNPPYRCAEQLVAHALALMPLVIILLRLSFLESVRRTSILDGGKLARVHVFKERLPRMHRRGLGTVALQHSGRVLREMGGVDVRTTLHSFSDHHYYRYYPPKKIGDLHGRRP